MCVCMVIYIYIYIYIYVYIYSYKLWGAFAHLDKYPTHLRPMSQLYPPESNRNYTSCFLEFSDGVGWDSAVGAFVRNGSFTDMVHGV